MREYSHDIVAKIIICGVCYIVLHGSVIYFYETFSEGTIINYFTVIASIGISVLISTHALRFKYFFDNISISKRYFSTKKVEWIDVKKIHVKEISLDIISKNDDVLTISNHFKTYKKMKHQILNIAEQNNIPISEEL